MQVAGAAAGVRIGTVLAPPGVRVHVCHAARPARPSALARAGWFPWLPVWLAGGIGLWFAWPVEPGAVVYLISALTIVGGLTLWLLGARLGEREWVSWRLVDGLRLLGLALAVAAAGFCIAGIRSAQVAAPVLGWRYYGPIEGRLVEVDRSARDRIRLTLDQVTLRDVAPARTPRRVRLTLGEDMGGGNIPPPGTRVMTTGHLGPPPGPAAPGSFDFRRQAWFEGLGAIGYTRNPVMVAVAANGGTTMWLQRLRQRMSQAMQQAIGGQEGAVASALMTGDRSGIAEATNAVMRDANLYHIVSISGLHMSMLAGFIYGALRMALAALGAMTGRGVGWPFHKLAAGVALAAAAFYLALSDGGVATERAFIMIAVMLGAIIVDRRAISLRTVALAALILLILAPEALTQPGFQMSFAATVVLILSYGPWSRVSPHIPRLLRPVAMLLLSSAVAGFATAPLAAAHFNRMSEYGLLANLLAVPLMGSVVMPAGVLAALLAPVGLAQPALWVMGVGTGLMLDIATYISGLKGAVSALPSPPGAVLPLLGLGGAFLALGGGGLGMPRGLVRGTGAALLIATLGLWLTTTRPLLLIAAEADAVGLMTPAGRAMSKVKGGRFSVATWLAEDGDTATPEAAGQRSGWGGTANARTAQLPSGRRVVHLTGKSGAEGIDTACRDNALVIVAADSKTKGAKGQSPRFGKAKKDSRGQKASAILPVQKTMAEEESAALKRKASASAEPSSCQIVDLASLRRTGALAVEADGTIFAVRDAVGRRAWTVRDRQGWGQSYGGRDTPIRAGKRLPAVKREEAGRTDAKTTPARLMQRKGSEGDEMPGNGGI